MASSKLVAAFFAAAAATTAQVAYGSFDVEPQSLLIDDECRGGDEACATNALQVRAHSAVAKNEPRGEDRWLPAALMGVNASAKWPAPPPKSEWMGYKYLATTTHYGTNKFTACDMDSGALVEGTDYLAVASAQAMQNMFPGGEGACGPGACRCGAAGPGTGGDDVAAMGCGTCGRGRFFRKLPRGFYIWTSAQEPIFHKEYKIVVVDVCPKFENKFWCPAKPGEKNELGVMNHLDFATFPDHIDNYYFAFTPEPCDPDMKARVEKMSKCHP
mmetsp:Transcript_8192/g.23429  ORF Transcript_8192/g.23429 Transcript_8192/m.23429 type:complete len:272 (-) Transcript_8192:168-983(-)|eukprot:CAMPEP_0170252718 /NCGR_PEP_ID=MMETSP0116_2-20130129/26195_1 /TAXON_ID=400756 /ORGANISM="Durinskia baltica, Strain CSIRO CS-38" /LENGTH=271 /DNA_ID=CAMNT_0010503693 /DNA_START=46 /DNA_END=861 /DNA_ORIENTATION=+